VLATSLYALRSVVNEMPGPEAAALGSRVTFTTAVEPSTSSLLGIIALPAPVPTDWSMVANTLGTLFPDCL
jgi:hypothetical protein